ncbi:MAG: hypothetical protein NTV68_06225, partial [Methanomicrobiales archaeon]|nr:hypothetical protein [Methanomicrobiales archaeon]
ALDLVYPETARVSAEMFCNYCPRFSFRGQVEKTDIPASPGPSLLLRYSYQCPWYDTGSSMSIPYLPAVVNGATGPRVKDLTVRQNLPPGVSPASGQVTSGSILLPPRKS